MYNARHLLPINYVIGSSFFYFYNTKRQVPVSAYIVRVHEIGCTFLFSKIFSRSLCLPSCNMEYFFSNFQKCITSSACVLYLTKSSFFFKLCVSSHGISRVWWVGGVYAPANMRGVLRRGVLRVPCRLFVHGRRRGVVESLGWSRIHSHRCPRELVLCVGMHCKKH